MGGGLGQCLYGGGGRTMSWDSVCRGGGGGRNGRIISARG